MFHLFNKVYLEHEQHISSKYSQVILSELEKPHPISKLVGREVGFIPCFEGYLSEYHNNSIEVFWAFLLQKDANKRFVVYSDDSVFFKLIIQYWKSIFNEPSSEFLFKLYQNYRHNHLLKSILGRDFAENNLGLNKDVFKKNSFEEFSSRIAEIAPVSAIRNHNKEVMSYEYLIADYTLDPNTINAAALKKRILNLAWANWCNDIHDMRSQIINCLPRLNFLDLDLKYEELDQPEVFFQSRPELSWVTDQNIKPENSNYIIRTYQPGLFSRIQSLLDKFDLIEIFKDGAIADDFHINNYLAKSEHLFAEDFQSLLNHDISRGIGSAFFKGESYFDANHYLINHIYSCIRSGQTEALKDFKLS